MADNVPPAYRPILHYLKIAHEHSSRDPAVYYWCVYYALQCAMKIDKKSPDCVKFLTEALADLEELKKKNKDNEILCNELVAHAHLEQCALKFFSHADIEDRNGRFDKNVVKCFYTAGYMFDVLEVFGELDQKIQEARKYAKWKAAYIHNCLKSGQTPKPGPQEEDITVPGPSEPKPMQPNPTEPEPNQYNQPESSSSTNHSKIDVYLKAQKLCKQAASALDYEDEMTAVDCIQKALNLLKS